MAIDLFQTLPDLHDDKLHVKFKLLRDNLTLAGEKAVVIEWADGFVDRDNKIVKEFQTSFHSALWEIFLHAFMKEAGFQVDYSKNRPDFILTAPTKVFVEAVVSEIKKDGRKEDTRGFDDMLEATTPITKSPHFYDIIDEAATRHSNSIRQKSSKYLNEYTQCQWVDTGAPFVVALGSYDQIHYGREFTHSMMTLLYGLRYDVSNDSYNQVESITKPGTQSPIPVGMFANEDYSHISAIIFSCTITLGKLTSLAISQGKYYGMNGVLNIRHDYDPPHFKGHLASTATPEYLSDGVFVFHNPHAKNPLPMDAFRATNAVSVFVDSQEIKAEGENLPLVQRINMLRHIVESDIFLMETLGRFNS